jgi:predicted  nucleic acid-binding Zn-ribbon protein
MLEASKALEAALMQKAEEVSIEWKNKMQQMEETMRERQRVVVETLEYSHSDDMEKEKKMAQEALDKLQQEMELKQKNALDIAHEKFIDDIEALKVRLANEKQQELISEREAHGKAIATLRQQNNETFENRMREVRKVWQEELENKLAEKDFDMKETLAAKMDAHAISMEAERIRGIKLEASKWKQAMKDAEKRFEVDNARAKAEGRAEKEKEAQDEKDHMEVKHKLALSKSLEERKNLLAEKENANIEALKNLKIEMENRMAEEVKNAQKNTKLEMDIEWTAKLKREIENALYDSSAAWEAKLQKEKDRLEKFKKEVTTQQQILAEERNNLKEQVDNNQDIMKKIETVLRQEKMTMQQGYETEIELLKNRMEKEKIKLEEEAKRAHADLMDNLGEKQQDELQYQLKVQREELEHQNEQAMSQLQEESGKLITKLEAALEELRQEKNKLKDDLEKTTSKLEDTEDSLYDLQQSMKKKDTQHSIATWKLLTGVNKMKAFYKEGMNEFDQQAAVAAEKLKKQMQNQVNEMILNAMKLATTVFEAEAARKKIHACLVSHKNDALGETRMKIKLYEKELERLIMERDSLEEQRDNMEEEIEMMELQVRDIEDQIREHSRTSSMQNGRINVAHARKKRRLDSELERILETIEQRRNTMGELDDRVADKSRQRDEKESEMIDLEKLLVSTLVEQQKLVLKLVEDARFVEEKAKLITHVARLPWPPPNDPTMADVKKLLDQESKRLEEEEK